MEKGWKKLGNMGPPVDAHVAAGGYDSVLLGVRELLHQCPKFGDLLLSWAMRRALSAMPSAVQDRGLLDRVGHGFAVMGRIEGLGEHATCNLRLTTRPGMPTTVLSLGTSFTTTEFPADAHVVPDMDVAEHLGARSNGDVVAQGEIALPAFVDPCRRV